MERQLVIHRGTGLVHEYGSSEAMSGSVCNYQNIMKEIKVGSSTSLKRFCNLWTNDWSALP